MITQITSEATTWLGYLQRGSVLLQVGLFVAAISSESRVKRKLSSPLIASLNASVRLLEKAERQRIENAYDEDERWRGLATDDFIRMVDALVVLTR